MTNNNEGLTMVWDGNSSNKEYTPLPPDKRSDLIDFVVSRVEAGTWDKLWDTSPNEAFLRDAGACLPIFYPYKRRSRPSKRRIKDILRGGGFVARWRIEDYGLWPWIRANFREIDVTGDEYVGVIDYSPTRP